MMIQSKTNNHLSLINNHCALGTTSTTVEDSLQIGSFMQNEPNFRKSQMNVTNLITADYEKWTLGERRKNEPKTNPIYPVVASGEAGLKPIKCQNKPNSNPNKANFKGKNSWFIWLLFGSGQAGQASRFYCLWEIGVYLSLVIS